MTHDVSTGPTYRSGEQVFNKSETRFLQGEDCPKGKIWGCSALWMIMGLYGTMQDAADLHQERACRYLTNRSSDKSKITSG